MSPEDIQDSFARSEKAERIGNFAYAETLCASILAGNPDEHKARLLLRRCQTARYRQKYASSKPQFRIGKGSIFSAKPGDDPLRDAASAEELIKDNPFHVAANQFLLQAAARLGWSEVEQLCLDLIAEGTPSPEHLIAKSKGLAKRGEFQRAIAVLTQAQKQFPGSLELDKALRDAQAEGASNDGFGKAKDFTDRLAPGQEHGNELARLTVAIELEPQNLRLIDQLISHLEYKGDAKLLLEWIAYRRGIEEHPALRRKAFDGERRQGLMSLEHELAELRHFVKEHPTDLDLRLALGGALLRAGDTKESILQLQAARRHGKIGIRVEALTALAQAYDAVGLEEPASRARTQALELAADDESLKKEILYQMAQSLEANQKLDEARIRWIELFELDAGFKDTADHVLPVTGE